MKIFTYSKQESSAILDLPLFPFARSPSLLLLILHLKNCEKAAVAAVVAAGVAAGVAPPPPPPPPPFFHNFLKKVVIFLKNRGGGGAGGGKVSEQKGREANPRWRNFNV